MKDLDKFLKPVWETGEIFREVFAMMEENGEVKAPFLYHPQTIIQVESYDGETIYEEGKDYVIEGDFFVRTKDSRIPYGKWEEFVFDTREEAQKDQDEAKYEFWCGPLLFTNGKYLNLSVIGHPEKLTKYDVCITYKTTEAWQGRIPQNRIQNLPNLQKKIQAGEEIHIVQFGDSICCGWDCSSNYHQKPYQPTWYDMVLEKAKKAWNCPIRFTNTSESGMNSDWALENVQERVIQHKPDLVILGFGMNDRLNMEEFRTITQKLMDAIKKENSEVEFVLLATSLPNALAETEPFYFWSKQDVYGESLEALCKEGVVCANIQDVQRDVMKKKRYLDVTGNLLNHPNDYLVRIQAQTVATTLGL